jgi:hypothetical protein
MPGATDLSRVRPPDRAPPRNIPPPAPQALGSEVRLSVPSDATVALQSAHDTGDLPPPGALSGSYMELRAQLDAWWASRRRDKKAALKMAKFLESCFQLTAYALFLALGVYVLHDSTWLYDRHECWKGFPHHELSPKVKLYYLSELAFYWYLFFSQFTDVRRKDFMEMCIHHMATIAVMSLSYAANYHRIGTLVMFLHDCADVMLQSGKLLKYAGWNTTTDVVFGLFATTFLVTRLFVFPVYILYSCVFDSYAYLDFFPGYFYFQSLMAVLLSLNFFWGWIIIKMAHKVPIAP